MLLAESDVVHGLIVSRLRCPCPEVRCSPLAPWLTTSQSEAPRRYPCSRKGSTTQIAECRKFLHPVERSEYPFSGTLAQASVELTCCLAKSVPQAAQAGPGVVDQAAQRSLRVH